MIQAANDIYKQMCLKEKQLSRQVLFFYSLHRWSHQYSQNHVCLFKKVLSHVLHLAWLKDCWLEAADDDNVDLILCQAEGGCLWFVEEPVVGGGLKTIPSLLEGLTNSCQCCAFSLLLLIYDLSVWSYKSIGVCAACIYEIWKNTASQQAVFVNILDYFTWPKMTINKSITIVPALPNPHSADGWSIDHYIEVLSRTYRTCTK